MELVPGVCKRAEKQREDDSGLNYGKQGILCVNSAFMLLMLSLEKDIYTLTSYEQLNQTHD